MQLRTSHWILALVTAAGLIAADTAGPAKVMMEAARKKEVVDGDLNGAIQQYKAIVAKYSADHATAAAALIRMAECYQKLGDGESRKIYEQVLHEYADQKDAVATARARLGIAGGGRTSVISSRRIWTAPPKADFYGKASPDGRYIPYTDWSENGDLFVHDLATGADRRLTNTADDKPGGSGEYAEETAFSRDSKQLAYTWFRKEGVELRVIGLQTAGVPQPRRLVGNQELKWISPYDWSPDGKSIAVHLTRTDRSAQIALVSVQDGSLRVLKSVDWRGPKGIFFSPDGKYLAYDIPADDPTGQHDVFVLASDGSREIPAVVHPSRDAVVGWSPDGKRLLFTSDRSGAIGLWALPFADGKPQGSPELLRGSVGEPGHRLENLGMTASGALYSAHYDPGGVGPDIQVAAFDLAEGRFLSNPVPAAQAFLGTNMYPTWSPDGKYLAYASMRDSHVVIGIRSMETGQVRELVPSPNFSDASPGYFWSLSWAPDGNSFIVTARGDKHGNGVFRIDAQTGQTSLIANATRPRTAVLSRDGKTLYYRTEAPNGQGVVIVKRDLASAEEKELIRRKYVFGGLNLSPDGRYIGIMTSDDPSGNPSALVLIPAAGGEPRELIRLPSAGAVNFSPDGRYIATGTTGRRLLAGAAEKAKAVLLIPVDGGEARELMRLSDQPGLGVAMWAPDSRSVLLKTGLLTLEQTEVWRVPVDGTQPRKLNINADHVAGGFLPSPDGRYVAFQTPRSQPKSTEIWVMENFLPASTAGK